MPVRPQPQTAVHPHRDPALDGLRGLAILLVFLFHYGGGLRAHSPAIRALGYLTQAGWVGVDLFFALSGFLITGHLARNLLTSRRPFSLPNSLDPVFREAENLPTLGASGLASETLISAPPQASAVSKDPRTTTLRNFFARRALRILPLYFAALLACAVTALFTGSTILHLKPLLIYAAFLQNLPLLVDPALHTPPPLPVFHLWSLAVEEQFYLLWPFALLAARTPRWALRLSLTIFAASCLFRAVIFAPGGLPWPTANTFATFLPTHAGALALGSALALYRGSTPRKRPLSRQPEALSSRLENGGRSGENPVFRNARATGTSLPIFAFSLALLVILGTALHTHTLLLNNRSAFLLTLPAADILSAAIVALTLQPNLVRTVLGTRPLAFLGRISYGFYVLHILLEPLFDHLGALLTHTRAGFPYQTARLLLAFPITMAAAWLSFTLIERPFLLLKRRFSYPVQQQVAQNSMLST